MDVSEHMWSSFELAVEDALSACSPGDTLVVCRDVTGACRGCERCPMCASVRVRREMRLPEVMAQIRSFGRA